MAVDDPDPVPLDELAGAAGRVRVAVIGGGIAGLVAALECAKVGLHVTVFEASDRLGGTVRTVEIDGMRVDTGADCFALRGELAPLVDALGLGDALVAPATETRWIAGLPGPQDTSSRSRSLSASASSRSRSLSASTSSRSRSLSAGARPLPDDTVLGIPENMFGDATREILGTGGMWRAYLDRLRPPLTIGHERSLGTLVRTRMGQKVLDRLVTPVTTGVYGALPGEIDVDVAAPGLNAALTRAGSLSGAVAMLRAERPAGSAIRSLKGGMSQLVDALAVRLGELGADVRTGSAVSGLESAGGDAWVVHTPDAEFDTSTGGPELEVFDAVVVATHEAQARRLLAPVVGSLTPVEPAGTLLETVTLVVESPALDDCPRGAEVLAMPGTRTAASVLHLTAKWGTARAGHHAVRVMFGGPGVRPATAGMTDAEAAEFARAEASALLGVEIDAGAVRGFDRARFTLSPSRAMTGRRALAERARNAIEATPRLAATGAWLAGSGLAQVVPDAVAAADRLRRRALFGEDTAS